MQTPSEIPLKADWAGRSAAKRRSVFGNYKGERDETKANSRAAGNGNVTNAATSLGEGNSRDQTNRGLGTLQSSIDEAVARSFIYRFIAKVFEDPSEENWSRLTEVGLQQALRISAKALGRALQASLEEAVQRLLTRLKPEAYHGFKLEYNGAFGHAARGLCPLNEIEYGDLKADPLFQPHRLADLAAFYQAFGLEVSDDAAERHDHICVELEFMSVLVAKEAYALELQLEEELLTRALNAQKSFLREHLGRWTLSFTRRLERMVSHENPLGALATLTREFIAAECARFGITLGSEELLLRPVDAAAESLCSSCGLNNLPPGALRTESL